MWCATLAEFTKRGAGYSWVAAEANDGDRIAISDDSEAVDFQGVQSAIAAAEAFLGQGDGSLAAPGDEERVLVAPGDSGSDEGGPGGKQFCMSCSRNPLFSVGGLVSEGLFWVLYLRNLP